MSVFALGIELDGEGNHPAAWRRAHHAPDALLTGETVKTRVAAAENAGFTLATFDDSIAAADTEIIGRIDAPNRAAFVAATTSTIGLVPFLGTTYAEPFHSASQLATLDYASRGRAGWIAAPVTDPAAAKVWGRPEVADEADRAREQRDSVTVARQLWDSWEDDAVIRDYASGRFLDRDKLHYIDFVGESFSVKGPAIVPRPPQGQLVVFGTEGDVDVHLISARSVDEIIEVAGDVVGLKFAEIDVTLDTASDTAAQRLADLDAHTPAEPTGRLQFVGTAAELTALLTELSTHVDGVRLHPTVVDEDLVVLARYVLPALFASGVAHRPVPGATLRANLGLTRPANRYTARLREKA